MKYRIVAFALFAIMGSTALLAGPPFITDDPQPVDFHHWEFYVASMQVISGGASDAALPLIEINYGALPEVQLHLILPMERSFVNGTANYGFSDTEFGVKYRFIDETSTSPQVGTFPMVELPTADPSSNLGNGSFEMFLPVWIQKSWGKFTTYGGAGWWYNPGSDKKNWFYLGWEAQYDISSMVTLGGEGFYHTSDEPGGRSDAGFNLGGYINFDETNHLLFSIGHNVLIRGAFTGYVGYQMTI